MFPGTIPEYIHTSIIIVDLPPRFKPSQALFTKFVNVAVNRFTFLVKNCQDAVFSASWQYFFSLFFSGYPYGTFHTDTLAVSSRLPKWKNQAFAASSLFFRIGRMIPSAVRTHGVMMFRHMVNRSSS